MEQSKSEQLQKLTHEYFNAAYSHINGGSQGTDLLRKAFTGVPEKQEAELPSYENRKMKFGTFENREFVIMMTDIRKSTNIINAENGVVNMFLIFYIYAGIVSKIVDNYGGTSTEFLGDGVLNLFDTKDLGRDEALKKAASASWDILDARQAVLNPFFTSVGLPNIDLGIGIDHGDTIVTKFGYMGDTDLKAFGKCAYNVSKICKGVNEIHTMNTTATIWPKSPDGLLRFDQPFVVGNNWVHKMYKV